jgi:hypothetical protein
MMDSNDIVSQLDKAGVKGTFFFSEFSHKAICQYVTDMTRQTETTV